MLFRLSGLVSWLCIVGLAGCAIVGPDGNEPADGIEKTYPDASGFAQVSLPALLQDVPTPADYNVVLYVTGRSICPKTHLCIIPDGIRVAATPEPDSTATSLFIPAMAPQQFHLKTRYLFSVHASERDGGEQARRSIRLLGYNHHPSPP